ncbi:hypothetical protein DRN38_01180 [Thermococci archaeon]|nr:MAG: hypothetical protein DRN38_01180 [Thermococci archaeon]
MGIRRWLLGFNPEDLKEWIPKVQSLEAEVKDLRQKIEELVKANQDMLKQLLQIQRDLENKADKKAMERELESLSKLVMAVYDKLKDLESYSEVSLGESLDQKDEELLVLNLLRQGYTSPSELLSRLKMSNKRLYAILKRLEAQGKVRKLRKKRRVHYVLIED